MKSLLPLLLLAVFATPLPAQKPAKTGSHIYKQDPRRKLTVYYPDNWTQADKRPALVIFRCNISFQREFFRKRGVVVIKPQTAPVNSGNLPKLTLEEIAKLPKPRDQVADTKSAIRFIRANAGKLGIDPAKIIATGTSGGGDLALQSHLNPHFEHDDDDKSVSPSPDALVLYCPAFDGIDIWFVKNSVIAERTRAQAPAFLPHLRTFIVDPDAEYARPVDHRADLIELAATLGKKHDLPADQITAFQSVLELFNNRDWQLLHPVADARKMSASRLLKSGDRPLPPTLILFGTRDHLREPQTNFIENARALGKKFELIEYEGGGHSFMTQPAFEEKSTQDVAGFLEKIGMLKRIQSAD
ncbi:MAG: alpha/beta hydrolase [Verrucomicrobiales bacterium]|nr:alpha/beta hydrolase [Verrucomicrobiales bacterium]